jgi:glycosyltransferase involved in cell wall biosynthesis
MEEGFFFISIPAKKEYFPEKIWTRLKKILFIFKVARIIRNKDFSIIHIDTNCRYYFLLKLLYPKIRMIYHIQSYPISLSKNRIGVYKTILGVFLQSFFLKSIIVQDEGQKHRWHGIKNLKKTKIVPIGFNKKVLYPYDLPLKEKKRELIGIKPHELVLIYAGAITLQRELERLIFAIKNVHDANNQLKVFFVGDGPYLSKIKELCCRLNIYDIFIFTGFIKYKEMVNFYGIADIGLSYVPINSNYTNNPALKTYEYLACGLPCIATKTVSNSRIISHNINGVLAGDSSKEISKAILSLWNDKAMLNRLKNNAFHSVERFDFEDITDKYVIPLYKKILM